MNHNTAIENNAAEQYVLGQMSDAECNDYEEHMFSCAACSEEVKYLAEFGEGVKTVFTENKVHPIYQLAEPHGFLAQWRQPLVQGLAIAAMLALSFNVYFMVVPHKLQPPKPFSVAPGEIFTLTEIRSKLREIVVAKNHSFQLKLEMPDGSSGLYHATVTNEDKIEAYSGDLDSKQPFIMVPAGSLQPGKYHISVTTLDKNKGEVAGFSFILKFGE